MFHSIGIGGGVLLYFGFGDSDGYIIGLADGVFFVRNRSKLLLCIGYNGRRFGYLWLGNSAPGPRATVSPLLWVEGPFHQGHHQPTENRDMCTTDLNSGNVTLGK